MLLHEAKEHPVDFIFLFLGLVVLGFFFFRFSHLPQIQEKIIIIASVFYFIWGVAHHLVRGDFHLKVLIEYLLFALLVLTGGFFVLSWA